MGIPNRKSRPLPNSYWIIQDRLAAGEYPGAKDPVKAAAKLKALLSTGIDHFIDLTEVTDELEPYDGLAKEEAGRLGLKVGHERHPIVDLSVPCSPERMAGILAAIDEALSEEKTVYVHCWGGVGRTGTVVGCWLVRHGHTGDGALGQIAEWWKGMSRSKTMLHPHSPETFQQHEYVRNWTEPSQER